MAAAFTAPDSDLVNTIHPTGNCTWGALTPKWGVLHTMETPETTQIAENIAGWFANPAAGTSAHYCIDPDSIVQCVDERAAAWAAMPTGNAFGIHLELAGRAAQTATEWADPASQAILDRAAALMADICTRHGIPVRFLTDQQLANGEKGITTHAQIRIRSHRPRRWIPRRTVPSSHAETLHRRSHRRNSKHSHRKRRRND